MTNIQLAQKAINEADALLITTGAGMGVDSGLPDFRGNSGFWQAYPPIAKLGLSFAEMANPQWFADDPAFAWAFYGHRLNLYRQTVPHLGFQLLLDLAKSMKASYFVVTSNVDGQFQKAGFDTNKIREIHGSIHFLQCSKPCCSTIWSADNFQIEINMATFRATSELPRCPKCEKIARPNILMFGDGGWIGNRTEDQSSEFQNWLNTLIGKRLVIVECGAGKAIPSIRMTSARVAQQLNATLIRINPRDFEVRSDQISIPTGALDGISLITGNNPI